MGDELAISLHASGAENASGQGDSVDLWGPDEDVLLRRFVDLQLVISAVSGSTPTLTVAIQTSPDDATWTQIGAFAQQSTVGSWKLAAGDCDRYVRAAWTIGGATPSFTFALAGSGVSTYASLSELDAWGLPAAVLAQLTDEVKIRAAIAATKEARSYLLARHTAPILNVGEDVKQAVAKLAGASLLLDHIGANPNPAATSAYLETKAMKLAWLKDVARGRAKADVTDSTPTTYEGTGAVVSAAIATGTRRGWGDSGIL